MRRSTVLLVAVALTAFVLTSAFATTVYLRGIMCPPDPANLPPRVIMAHPIFCVVSHKIFGNPGDWGIF
jgi:hypothetical protein